MKKLTMLLLIAAFATICLAQRVNVEEIPYDAAEELDGIKDISYYDVDRGALKYQGWVDFDWQWQPEVLFTDPNESLQEVNTKVTIQVAGMGQEAFELTGYGLPPACGIKIFKPSRIRLIKGKSDFP